MKLSNDRRHIDGWSFLQSFVFPAANGIAGAYMGVKITLATIELDINYLKRDVDTLQLIVSKVRDNQAALQANQVWKANKDDRDKQQDKELEALWRRLNAIEIQRAGND